jgi:hypothetical protein
LQPSQKVPAGFIEVGHGCGLFLVSGETRVRAGNDRRFLWRRVMCKVEDKRILRRLESVRSIRSCTNAPRARKEKRWSRNVSVKN